MLDGEEPLRRGYPPTSVRPLELPAKYASWFVSSSRKGDCCTLKVSSFSCDSSRASEDAGEGIDGLLGAWALGECECMRESMSIFSSFSSSKSFSSRTSDSSVRTRSSSDSVYPRGNARRLSLSLVLHSNPTLVHCVQLGRIPSHRIFLERHRSQACAMRAWQLDPTLITFMGKIPGMSAVVYGASLFCCVFVLGLGGRSLTAWYAISHHPVFRLVRVSEVCRWTVQRSPSARADLVAW
jgi:hypothetical protein